MRIWIARDNEFELYIYFNAEPVWDEEHEVFEPQGERLSDLNKLPCMLFPEIESGKCREFELKEVENEK